MAQLVTIDDSNFHLHVNHYGPDGKIRQRGLRPRDFQAQPQGFLMEAEPFPDSLLVDESEWPERIAEQDAKQSSLQHVRRTALNGQPIPSLDQDGVGYCWVHSGTNLMKLVRAAANLPYVPLSAFMAGCLIKNYRDEGGNGIDGVKFFSSVGICSEQFWPAQAMNRKYDTPDMRANAALHKALRWWDLSDDSTLRRKQVASCLLRNIPVLGDFNWWGHSVAMLRILSGTKTKIWNSWGDSWSDDGEGDLQNSKAWPDNAVAVAVETASMT